MGLGSNKLEPGSDNIELGSNKIELSSDMIEYGNTKMKCDSGRYQQYRRDATSYRIYMGSNKITHRMLKQRTMKKTNSRLVKTCKPNKGSCSSY